MQHNKSFAEVFSRALYARSMAGFGCQVMCNGFVWTRVVFTRVRFLGRAGRGTRLLLVSSHLGNS